MPQPIRIGNRLLGAGQPCYVIAEAGSNHNGSLEMARTLIDVAAEAGCDAVKFQVFSASKLYPPGAGKSDYLGDERSIYDIIRAMELPDGWLPELVAHSRARGLDFLCSAFDEGAVDLIAPYVDAFKCASYEMTHTPLLQHMVRLGKPVLLSTGTATLDEVGEAVAAVREIAPELPLVLLQCTAAYPAPLESARVRVLTTLRETFDTWSGLSDHTREHAAAVAAVALGAVVIEKHYTLSNRLPGPDHSFALEPHELRELVRRIRETEQVLGDGRKEVDEVEWELRQFARRSVFTTRALHAGEAFTAYNTAVLRQGKLPAGIAPRHWHQVLQHQAARELPPWTSLQADDVADAPELQPPAVTLRRARPDDARAVWRWNNDASARAVSLNSADIPWPDHERWFAARVADPKVRLWIVERAGQSCGVIRIERDAVSIALAPEVRGQGVGALALEQAWQRHVGETGARSVEAWILPENVASLRAFERAGFVQRREEVVQGRKVLVHVRQVQG
jgi:N-acetylneuraminate synthase